VRLGAVHLQVAQLDRSLEFYQQVLGLRVVERGVSHAALAARGGDEILVVLQERPGARPVRRGLLGLYHFAILLPSRAALGRFLRHAAALGVRVGAGDHLVSEALYLADPDGLGIEVYADRPRSHWHRVGRALQMATDPVDVDGLLAEAGDAPWEGMPAGTRMGHVHLHVGSLPEAERFYHTALGLDVMTRDYPGALFLGAGGYHHHVGTNTWAGAGALPAAEGEARLLAWTLTLPSAEALRAAAQQLAACGVPAEPSADGTLMVRDPWGTAVRVVAG
jgi:catechol 2,3-dioxygenase